MSKYKEFIVRMDKLVGRTESDLENVSKQELAEALTECANRVYAANRIIANSINPMLDAGQKEGAKAATGLYGMIFGDDELQEQLIQMVPDE